MNGEKLPLLTIRMSSKPRCFRASPIPIMYRSQSNAWINCDIFNEYLHKLDHKLVSQNKSIKMFIDNCRAHPKDYPKLKNIAVRFYPTNLISKCQPIDMCIINCLKCHYKHTLASKIIRFNIKNLTRKIFILKKSFRCAENNVVFIISVLYAAHFIKKRGISVMRRL